MTRRTRLTTRAALLAVVLVALVLTLAYPLRLYLAQRGQIQSATADNEDKRASEAALEKSVKKYNDPAWVRDQARLRLHYIGPNERIYVVGQTPAPRPSTAVTASARPSARATTSPAGGLSQVRRVPSTVTPTPAR